MAIKKIKLPRITQPVGIGATTTISSAEGANF